MTKQPQRLTLSLNATDTDEGSHMRLRAQPPAIVDLTDAARLEKKKPGARLGRTLKSDDGRELHLAIAKSVANQQSALAPAQPSAPPPVPSEALKITQQCAILNAAISGRFKMLHNRQTVAPNGHRTLVLRFFIAEGTTPNHRPTAAQLGSFELTLRNEGTGNCLSATAYEAAVQPTHMDVMFTIDEKVTAISPDLLNSDATVYLQYQSQPFKTLNGKDGQIIIK